LDRSSRRLAAAPPQEEGNRSRRADAKDGTDARLSARDSHCRSAEETKEKKKATRKEGLGSVALHGGLLGEAGGRAKEQAARTQALESKQGKGGVNRVWWAVIGSLAIKRGRMQTFIASRDALDDACKLIDLFGADAGLEAAVRAEGARDNGNVLRFCHWRQIERVIVTLSSDLPVGTVH
jgi:hypothetical protein